MRLPDCAGCTHPDPGGTHALGTRQHPDPAHAMTERELSQAVVDLARLLRWRVHRDPPWRSTGTDAGYPDLTLVREGKVIWAELKREGGKLTAAQKAWFAALPGDDEWVTVCIWTPRHWYAGLIEEALR